MDIYRIHDRRFDALSGFGAGARGGRWNPRGVPVVYTSPAYEAMLLEVPSHVTQPWGRNVLLNPRHADFDRVRVAEIVDVGWDPRLF